MNKMEGEQQLSAEGHCNSYRWECNSSSTIIGDSTNKNSIPDFSNAVLKRGTKRTKEGLAEMLKGGVIMDVTSVEQAIIAEKAGACAVMALDKIPSELRKSNAVARMPNPSVIKAIMKAVSIPVMSKCRIGHFVEAQILEALGVDFADESEVLTSADSSNHIDKRPFCMPFVCGSSCLGEALRRIAEGASMIRTKGEAGTGNVRHAVDHIRRIQLEIKQLTSLENDEVFAFASEIQAPLALVEETRRRKRLPVVNFAAGGIATPADAALCMQLGMDGVFVGSGIFAAAQPEKRARAIVQAVTHYRDAAKLAEFSADLGEEMKGIAYLEESNILSRARM